MAQIENTCERREAQRASYCFPTNELNSTDRYLLHCAWWGSCTMVTSLERHGGVECMRLPTRAGRWSRATGSKSMMTISVRSSLNLSSTPGCSNGNAVYRPCRSGYDYEVSGTGRASRHADENQVDCVGRLSSLQHRQEKPGR